MLMVVMLKLPPLELGIPAYMYCMRLLPDLFQLALASILMSRKGSMVIFICRSSVAVDDAVWAMLSPLSNQPLLMALYR